MNQLLFKLVVLFGINFFLVVGLILLRTEAQLSSDFFFGLFLGGLGTFINILWDIVLERD